MKPLLTSYKMYSSQFSFFFSLLTVCLNQNPNEVHMLQLVNISQSTDFPSVITILFCNVFVQETCPFGHVASPPICISRITSQWYISTDPSVPSVVCTFCSQFQSLDYFGVLSFSMNTSQVFLKQIFKRGFLKQKNNSLPSELRMQIKIYCQYQFS